MVGKFLLKLVNLCRFILLSPKQYYYLWLAGNSNLFDKQFYVSTNLGLNRFFRRFPIRHYIALGESANLRPNPIFSPEAYVRHNHDLGALTARPFLHYITHGHKEVRLTKDVPIGKDGARFVAPTLRLSPDAPPPKDYAVYIHIYYHDLWSDFAVRLQRLDIEFDLFVTITDFDEDTDELTKTIKQDFPGALIVPMPNHGRDIFPFMHIINAGLLATYKAVCKFHTKKLPHREDGNEWRDHLIEGIILGQGTASLVEAFLADGKAAFLVANGQHYTGDEWWGSNFKATTTMLRRVEITCDRDELSFPAGSIYWVKPMMLSMIKGLQLDQRSFELERGLLDGTVAHAFERAIGYLAMNAGQTIRQVSDLKETRKAPPPLACPKFTSAFYLP